LGVNLNFHAATLYGRTLRKHEAVKILFRARKRPALQRLRLSVNARKSSVRTMRMTVRR
jgi:hypothetical protein